MRIRTYRFNHDFQAPEEAYYRIIAGNGWFFHVKTPFFEAVVLETPLRRSNRLLPCEERVALTLQRKLSQNDVVTAHAFFSTVRRDHHAEAFLRLFAHPITGELLLDAPPQVNRSSCVMADATVAPDGFCEIGSIHSHPHPRAHHHRGGSPPTTEDWSRYCPEREMARTIPHRVPTVNPRQERERRRMAARHRPHQQPRALVFPRTVHACIP
jgi:hypothetical protein